MSIESVMPSNHLILCHPLLLLPPIFPRVFSNESALLIRWPKYWSFSFSISPSDEYPELNSLALSFLYSPSLTSIHNYWKNHSFDWTFVGKVMSLLFNMLSRLVITFLPRSKRLLISWLQPPSAMILEPPKIKSLSLFPLFPYLFSMKWWDQMPWS